jgi:biopolymer transport protein ExbD
MNRGTPLAPTFRQVDVHPYPLVTASLLTLLFLAFLMLTPVGSIHKPLLLPVATSAPTILDTGNLIHISIQADGFVFIDAKWYPLSDLPRALHHAVLVTPPCRGCGLVLSIDRSLPFSSVRRFLSLLAAAGASHVILDVEPASASLPVPGT